MHRSAEQTDRFLTRVSESEKILEPAERKGLRLLASTLKDVVAVGRDAYQLGSRDEGQNQCIVNLAFLQEYESEVPLVVAVRGVAATNCEQPTDFQPSFLFRALSIYAIE